MQLPDMSCGSRLIWVVASCLTWIFVPNWVGVEMIAGILCRSEFWWVLRMNGGRKGVGNGLDSGVLWLSPTVTCDVILVQACQMQASVLIMCDDHTVIGWLIRQEGWQHSTVACSISSLLQHCFRYSDSFGLSHSSGLLLFGCRHQQQALKVPAWPGVAARLQAVPWRQCNLGQFLR